MKRKYTVSRMEVWLSSLDASASRLFYFWHDLINKDKNFIPPSRKWKRYCFRISVLFFIEQIWQLNHGILLRANNESRLYFCSFSDHFFELNQKAYNWNIPAHQDISRSLWWEIVPWESPNLITLAGKPPRAWEALPGLIKWVSSTLS